MAEETLDLISRYRDESSAGLRQTQSLLAGFGDVLGAPMRALGGFTDALGKIGLAGLGVKTLIESVSGLASGMVSGNAEFERYETQFGVLLKSSDAAKERLQELADFGARTPFELPEVVRADKILTAFGLDSANTAERFGVSGAQIRETIGDIASGTGAGFEEVANLMGRFASGATGEAIMRFQELGISTREEMATWGLQFSKSGELLTPYREAFTVLEKHVREKYGGMMNAQSQTFEGMVSNLQDWLGAAKRQIMAPLFEVLKDKLQSLLDFLGSDQAKATLNSIAAGLAQGVSLAAGAVSWLIDKVAALVGYLDPENQRDVMREWFGDAGPVIDEVTRMVKGLIAALGYLGQGDIGMFTELVHEWTGIDLGPFVDGINRVAQVIGSVVGYATSGDLGMVREIIAEWTGIDLGPLLNFGSALVNVFTTLGSSVAALVRSGNFGAFAQGIADAYGQYLSAAGGLAMSIGQSVVAAIQQYAPIIAQQLQTWGQAFLDWVQPQIPPLLAQLDALATAAWGWVQAQAAPLLAQLGTWAKAFGEWIGPATQQFLANWPAMLESILSSIDAALPSILEAIGNAVGPIAAKLLEWGVAFAQWIGPALPGILLALAQITAAILVFVGETAFTLYKHANEKWGPAITKWIAEVVIPALPGMFEDLWQGYKAAIAALQLRLGQAMLAWVQQEVLPKLGTELDKIVTALSDWVTAAIANVQSEARRISDAIIQGLRSGIEDKAREVAGAAVKVAVDALNAAKTALGISSPSKEFQLIGASMVEGMILGLDTPDLVDHMNQLTNAMLTATRNVAREMSGAFDQVFAIRGGGAGLSGILHGTSRAAQELLTLIQEKAGGAPGWNPSAGTVGLFAQINAQFGEFSRKSGIVDQIKGLVAGFDAMKMALPDELVTSLRILGYELGGPFKTAIDDLLGPAHAAAQAVKAFLQEMDLGQQLAGMVRTLQTVGMQIPPEMLKALQDMPRTAGGFLDTVIKQILHEYKVPGFAAGGVVPGPVGQPVLAVVHGGERITPAGQSTGNTYSFNLTVNSPAPANIQQEFALMRAMVA